jgi:hypothetical protein
MTTLTYNDQENEPKIATKSHLSKWAPNSASSLAILSILTPNNKQNNLNTKQITIEDQIDKEKERQQTLKSKKEREDFNRLLVEFHRHKSVNAPIFQLPTLNGKQIDLLKLYQKVCALGGWEKVCEKDKWYEIGIDLDESLFKSCANGSHALKLIYIRYLSVYEKFDCQVNVNASLSAGNINLTGLIDAFSASNPGMLHSTSSFLNLNSVSVTINQSLINSTYGLIRDSNQSNLNQYQKFDSGNETDSGRRKFSYLLDTPMNYNYNQHVLNANLGTSFNPYEKLEISLESGLPNEVDFAFNTLLMLSSDESHQFKLTSSKRLIDLMLAHCGFFGLKDRFDLRNLYDNVWNAYKTKSDESSRSDLLVAYLRDENKYKKEKLDEKFKKEPTRNFVKFWHNCIHIPYDDSNEQKSMIKKLLPKLYNERKFNNTYFFVPKSSKTVIRLLF